MKNLNQSITFSKLQYPESFIHYAKSKPINIHKHTSHNMNKNKPCSNSNSIKRHNFTPRSHYQPNWKNLNCLGIKTITHKTETIKRIAKNNFKNTDFLSNAGVYKIRCQNCHKFYTGETSRNLNKKKIYECKDFKTGNTTNSLVSHNILTNHTFDFRNSVIFDFIEDKNKRIIKACSI